MTIEAKRRVPVRKRASKRMSLDELHTVILKLDEVRSQRDELDEQCQAMQKTVLETMMTLPVDQRTQVAEDGTRKVQATVVESSTLQLNETSLKRKLGATLWKKVTTVVLDRKKLDAYMKSGEVDPLIVAQCSTEMPRTPYIRVTRKK